MKNQEGIRVFAAAGWPLGHARGERDYELLDTGAGEKLERVGAYTFVRPYEGAVWPKTLAKAEWDKSSGVFSASAGGKKAGWKLKPGLPDRWPLAYGTLKFFAQPTPFRHFGFFPEQASHWDFISEKIKNAGSKNRKITFLNLFGYTGLASLAALAAGAEVTHVDASKTSLSWAKENQKLNPELAEGMRIIADDAVKFLEREAKRGMRYDAVIMDPPKFGRGPKGEVWKFEADLPRLLAAVKKVLSPDPLFVILTSYAVDSSPLVLRYALEEIMKDFGGSAVAGELCVTEKSNGRNIPLANTAVWTRS